ncbi:DUF411 domain-containing protein [Caldimonas tepidiphila]|uniref:DUF411 domain-containing protein n=1 Tax=Caldimonas tepidiphila TaxID=2315841 RepID=UPI000E5BECD1|nr:DUF411 domain-containing protein [Caldimonas tepidiphila]
MNSRRQFLLGATAAATALALGPALAAPAKPQIEVWKSPSCGCCQGWVEHLEKNGFEVKVNDVPGPADYREKFGLAAQYGSCHTAKVGGYVLEGHVPAREIHRLLKEKPQALGLAVPGMPVGSPGMEVESGRVDAYEVLLVTKDNRASVYQRYAAKA